MRQGTTTTFHQFLTPSHFHTILLVVGKGHQHASHRNTLSFYFDSAKTLVDATPQFALFHSQTQANTRCSSSKRYFDALLHVFNILNRLIRACDVSSSLDASSTSSICFGSCTGFFRFFYLAHALAFANASSITILKAWSSTLGWFPSPSTPNFSIHHAVAFQGTVESSSQRQKQSIATSAPKPNVAPTCMVPQRQGYSPQVRHKEDTERSGNPGKEC